MKQHEVYRLFAQKDCEHQLQKQFKCSECPFDFRECNFEKKAKS